MEQDEVKIPEHEYMDQVDTHPDVDRVTEDDETTVLQDLYGEPDEDGVFRGEETG